MASSFNESMFDSNEQSSNSNLFLEKLQSTSFSYFMTVESLQATVGNGTYNLECDDDNKNNFTLSPLGASSSIPSPVNNSLNTSMTPSTFPTRVPVSRDCETPETCPARNEIIVPQSRCTQIFSIPIFFSMQGSNIPGEMERDVLEEYQKTLELLLQDNFNSACLIETEENCTNIYEAKLLLLMQRLKLKNSYLRQAVMELDVLEEYQKVLELLLQDNFNSACLIETEENCTNIYEAQTVTFNATVKAQEFISPPTSQPTFDPTLAPSFSPTIKTTSKEQVLSPFDAGGAAGPNTNSMPDVQAPTLGPSVFLECASNENRFTIDVFADAYPQEISWELKSFLGSTILSVSPFTYQIAEVFYHDMTCIPIDKCFVFSISDTHGDGFCCNEGNGKYTVSLDGIQIITGGDFESREETIFGSNCSKVPFDSGLNVSPDISSEPFSPNVLNQSPPSTTPNRFSSSNNPNDTKSIFPTPSNPSANWTRIPTLKPTSAEPLNNIFTELPTTIRPTSPPTPEPFKPIKGVEGEFKLKLNGYVLNFESIDGIPRPGDNVILTPPAVGENNGVENTWKFTRNGYFKLGSDPSLIMEIRDGSLKPGAVVQLNIMNKETECCQTWDVTNEGYIMSTASKDIVLGIDNSRSLDSMKIKTDYKNGTTAIQLSYTKTTIPPTNEPTADPSLWPSLKTSTNPSLEQSKTPSTNPSSFLSLRPSQAVSNIPSRFPSLDPSSKPSLKKSNLPSKFPTVTPTSKSSLKPSLQPSALLSAQPSGVLSSTPTAIPSLNPSLKSSMPSNIPTVELSISPSMIPSKLPSLDPSSKPSLMKSNVPSEIPSVSSAPSLNPSPAPTSLPSSAPSAFPTMRPSALPSVSMI
eukprot:CAMPEP_0194445642 /NCGR_PEP_ID=MMETSP0176-20130528/127981_1 /TAXON_ID=216777 /ORGANISM="Proboscia alata, Strain PI-D3" /LENGTH=864 /DNA_ID=CAMNT_0039272237 /DNA_START=93 /DNA_END=2685 /DNA_ORIENTATION=+